MGWSKRINNKNYFIGSAVNLGFATYAGLPSAISTWWLCYIVLSAALNHFFTVEALNYLAETRVKRNLKTSTAKILFYLVFKTLFLISGFIFLVLFARDKVLQGLFIYTFQLIILGLSIKNIELFFKKGS